MGRDGFETFRRCFADAMVRGPRGAPTAPVGMVHTIPASSSSRLSIRSVARGTSRPRDGAATSPPEDRATRPGRGRVRRRRDRDARRDPRVRVAVPVLREAPRGARPRVPAAAPRGPLRAAAAGPRAAPRQPSRAALRDAALRRLPEAVERDLLRVTVDARGVLRPPPAPHGSTGAHPAPSGEPVPRGSAPERARPRSSATSGEPAREHPLRLPAKLRTEQRLRRTSKGRPHMCASATAVGDLETRTRL